LGNLLSTTAFDISISVDLAYSWHFKHTNRIDQAPSEVYLSL